MGPINLFQAFAFASFTNSFASQDHDDHNKNRRENKDDNDENLLSEAHELFANLMLLIVVIHVAYLFLFKRYMAKFMLFIPNKK